MNQDKDVWLEKVDTTKRVSDYMIGMKLKNVRKVSLSIPKECVCRNSLLLLRRIPIGLTCLVRFQTRQSCRHEKEYVIKNRRVALKDIPVWNKMVSEWNDACNQQVVILTK